MWESAQGYSVIAIIPTTLTINSLPNVDHILERLTSSPRNRETVARLVRGYLRYFPLTVGKRTVWDRVIEPYLLWHPLEFIARTRFGARLAGNAEDLVQQFIFFFGLWEPNVTHWLQRQLVAGDTFVDVGANIGYFALLASRAVGESGRVIAIEASPSIFSALRANLDRNRARNVCAVNMAAARAAGKLPIYRASEHNVGETTAVAGQGFALEAEIEADTLEAIVTSEVLRAARLVKIDIEGGELAVVESLRGFLADSPARLEFIVELHPQRLAAQNQRAEDVLRIFADAGFHCYRLENDTWAHSHLPPFAEPVPRRFTGEVDEEMNLVFSRRNAEAI